MNVNTQQLLQLSLSTSIMPEISNGMHIHFVGIGGSGMSGIAEVLVYEGYKISGSDLQPNALTDQLIGLGAKIIFNHQPENISKACMVVVSTAIPLDNPELIAAHNARIPVILRAEMLAQLMRFRYGIAITGTHGKTTTTAMIASIFAKAGLDPTFINGGLIKADGNGVHARLGTSRYFIVEADESDASLLHLQPLVAVITNIEADHMENYDGKFEKLKHTFISFIHNIPYYGLVVLCIDDPVVRSLLPEIGVYNITTYGFSYDADIRITSYRQSGNKCYFSVSRARENKSDLTIILNAPGKHNALNATAAIAVATKEGINDNSILIALEKFQGTGRRFDYLGDFSLADINGKKGSVMLVDDYGHHPTEVNATIKAAREGWPDKRLVMVFQPHRYTRTRDLYYDFANILEQVDVLLMLDVYSAGEKIIPGADSRSLCQTISNRDKLCPIFVNEPKEISTILANIIEDNDLIIIQGAGNIEKIARSLAKTALRKSCSKS